MKPFLIGVAGGTGSGKTTVARKIYDALHLDSAVLLDQDAYYRELSHLSLEERSQVNFDHPDAFDSDLLVEHLKELAIGRAIEKPLYDFSRHTRSADSVRVEPRDVIVLEGILALAEPAVRDLLDLKIFVDADADIRFIRRLERDMEERGRSLDDVVQQYLSTVRPMHFEFVEPSKRYADIILPRGGHNESGIAVIVARVRERLAERSRSRVSRQGGVDATFA